ncbi:hypothetical protein D9M71_806660 [compost metagenome]
MRTVSQPVAAISSGLSTCAARAIASRRALELLPASTLPSWGSRLLKRSASSSGRMPASLAAGISKTASGRAASSGCKTFR